MKVESSCSSQEHEKYRWSVTLPPTGSFDIVHDVNLKVPNVRGLPPREGARRYRDLEEQSTGYRRAGGSVTLFGESRYELEELSRRFCPVPKPQPLTPSARLRDFIANDPDFATDASLYEALDEAFDTDIIQSALAEFDTWMKP